jgi:hypothetical protein
MASILRLLISSGSRKKDPRYACLIEARASHSHRMWDEVSSAVPHLLHKGLFISPFKWRCLFRVLCPLTSITALGCVLSKDDNLVFVVGLGPIISFWVCLWVLLGSHHFAKCWCPPSVLSSYELLNRIVWCEIVSDFISLCPSMSKNPIQSHCVPVEISFNTFWHCHTNGDVLAAWSAFRATWLSEQILTYFSGLTWVWIS